jgi:hypothetical protein
MPSFSTRNACLCLVACFLLDFRIGGLTRQPKVEEDHKFNHDIRCAIQTEHGHWNRNTETTISGTIENLTDGPFEANVDSVFYLSSRTSSELGDRFWAPVDLLHDSPSVPTRRRDGGVRVTIERRPIHLQFKSKGDKIDFRIDAQHLRWAKETSSVWPQSSLFRVVKSDDYDLQLVMETDRGRVESPKVKISIDVGKSPK